MKKTKQTEPYAGPFPRKRHFHRCETCWATRKQGAVYCYKTKCSKPQSSEDCALCRPIQKYGQTPDPAPAPAPAQLAPKLKTLDPGPDDDEGRTRIGNTPTCEDCGEALDDCECGDDDDEPRCRLCDEEIEEGEDLCDDCQERNVRRDDEDEPESGGLFGPAAPEKTKQSSLTAQFDREAWERTLKTRREFAENPERIKAALPRFLEMLRELDAAIKADDIKAAAEIETRADQYATELQGGDRCGILSPDGPATILEKAAAAPDGEVPMWGQRGNFVLMVGLTPIRFEYDGIFGTAGFFSFSIHAVRWDKPFPSETGYRFFCGISLSHVPKGATVADFVTDEVQRYIREECKKGLPMIGFEHRDRHADDPENSLPIASAAPQSGPFEPKVIVGLREQAKAPEPPQPQQTLFGPAFPKATRKPVTAAPSGQLSLFGGAA